MRYSLPQEAALIPVPRSGLKMCNADACLVYVQELRGALGAQTAALYGLCHPKTAQSIVHSSWHQRPPKELGPSAPSL